MKTGRVDIITGFSCNNNCLFCMLADDYKRLGQRKKKEIIDDLKKTKKYCNSLTFCGGEPTIHKDLPYLVKFSKSIGFLDIHIQTNARMLRYPSFCSNLIKSGINSFTVSLHASDERLADLLSKTEGSFTQTIEGIKNIKKFGAKLITNTLICKENYKYLYEIVSLALSLGADQIQIVFVRPKGKAYENFDLLVPRMYKVVPFILKCVNLCNSKKIPILVEAIPLCLIPNCEDYLAEKYMPNVELKSGKVSLSNKSIKKIKFEKCKKCTYNPHCDGVWKEYADVFGDKEFKPLNCPY